VAAHLLEQSQGGAGVDGTMLTVRRSGSRILAEPTLTAIGVGTAVEQRHYDVIVMDDLATFEAAQSEVVMTRAKARRTALRSRLNDVAHSIEIGIGTHWTPTDIYVDWKKDPSVECCIRAAIEHGEPIWPERHPLKELLALQEEEGIGKILFSANYMNNPLNESFTALDWQEVRMYEFDHEAQAVVWVSSQVDEQLHARNSLSVLENANLYALYGRPICGMRLNQLYHHLRPAPEESEEELHARRMQRMLRRRDAEFEGSALWVRLDELAIRKQREHEQGRHTEPGADAQQRDGGPGDE
jgi:hypothetical protein